MAFLLPATFQKRLVRYVLSQLSFLDMACFDLDRLEGAWGRKTTGEIRDIPFKIDKLTELLKLPPWVKVRQAEVHSLRLTVPLNIWSEGIEIAIDGVAIKCSVEDDRPKEKGLQKGVKSNQPRDPRQETHDPGGEEHGGLPSIEDMAQSFVDHQPEDEKERLRNELAQHANLEDSQSSLDEEEVGLGTQFSLPAVMADFLWGVGERLKVSVKNIKFEVDFPIDVPATRPLQSSAEKVAFRLTVDSVELQGVQTSKESKAENESSVSLGNHRIAVTNVQGFVVSEPSLFTAFSAMSVPPSPTATHASSFRPDDVSESSRSAPGSDVSGTGSGSTKPESMTESQELAMSSSTILDAPPETFRSMYDADEAEQYDESEIPDYLKRSMSDSRYHGFGSEGGLSQFDEYSSPDQSFLENGRLDSPEASLSTLQESQTLPREHLNRSSASRKLAPKGSSVEASSASKSSMPTLPPSQLLERVTDREKDLSQSVHTGTSEMTQSVFHDFPGNEVAEDPIAESRIFHDTRSRADSSSSAGNPVSSDSESVEASQSLPAIDQGRSITTEASTDDLMQSTLFSHEEAQSIYMSAMDSRDTANDDDDGEVQMPGGWGSESVYTDTESTPLALRESVLRHQRKDSDATVNEAASSRELATDERSGQYSSADNVNSEDGTDLHNSEYENRTALRKRFLHLQSITIEIPVALFRMERADPNGSDPLVMSQRPKATKMPGEMSMYDETLSRLERSTMRASFTAARQESFGSDTNDTDASISVAIDQLDLANDMGLVKLLISATQQLLAYRSSEVEVQSSSKPNAEPGLAWTVKLDSFSWSFVDSMDSQLDSSLSSETGAGIIGSSVLLVTKIQALSVQHRPQNSGSVFNISIGQYSLGYTDEEILKFDALSGPEKSSQWSKDISVKVHLIPGRGPEIKISTAPLRVTLDLRRLDETFGWFGGLSGMIGLSNSVMSTTTIIEPKKPPKPVRVRFDTSGGLPMVEERPATESSTATKVTAVLNGIFLDLLGQSSSLHLNTSPMKLVHRPEGLGVQIDRLNFSGPVVYDSEGDPPIDIKFGPLKMSFLQAPREQDLGRLLGLISPSAQRQEEADDDVLVDTLIRQRRKGGVLHLNVESVQGQVEHLEELEHLSVLGDEMKKLATVTKYLPEDDRPGIMVLSIVQHIHVDLDVNSRLGRLSIDTRNLDMAFVTMPMLFLLSVDSINATRGEERLVGQVVPARTRQVRGNVFENSSFMPMVLTKFIGNDLEPTVKVRLTNFCAEYHVTTVMALMGIHETASGEVIVAEMIQSVANLAQASSVPVTSPQSSHTDSRSTNSKSVKLDIKFRECALGLNPRRSQAKGLLLLTDTQLKTTLPADSGSAIDAVMELNKVSFLVVDDTRTLKGFQESPEPGLTFAPIYGGETAALSRMGYVPTADLSKAKFSIQMSAKDTNGERTMEVEILDELFVLDSCADSTQTMIAIFSGLSPPMPPSTELKYRTEVMPVEDMLNSIVGEVVVSEDETEKSSSKDSKTGPVSYDFAKQLGYAVPDVEDDEDKLAEDVVTAKSKLTALNLSDSQFFMRRETVWEGTALEFNSDSNKYQKASRAKISKSPLRIKVKNINFHWNLYDGFDWQHTRTVIGEAVADVEKRAAARKASRRRSTEREEQDEESVIGDFLFNSVYIGVGAKDDPRDLARQVNRHLADDDLETASYATPTTVISNTTNARSNLSKTKRKHLRLERSKHHKITIQLNGLSADVVIFPPGSGETQTSVVLRVHDLEIYDHIHTSTWKKFATYMHDYGPRDVSTPMVQIELLNVKPVSDLPASELVLRVSVLPLRLHVDQDALDFLTRFFEFKDTGREGSDNPSTPGEEPFIQRFEIFAVPVKLDFKPKRVDYGGLRSGRTTEFMNFIILDGSDMVLDHIIMYGVSGFERLGKMLNDIWMPAIKQNQLPGVLAGLAPVRGIVNVGSGVKDLVMVPWQEYRKDGRLMRAIQKGAFAFARNTTTELTRLGARVALGTQTVLQNAEDLLGGQSASDDPPANPRNTPGADEDTPQQISPYADQPLGVLAGLRGAYRHLERDMLYAKDAVIAMPGEVRDSGSASGAARAVLRGAPTVVLRPAMGVTRAIGTAFMGATNALDKDERRRADDVSYKRSQQGLQ